MRLHPGAIVLACLCLFVFPQALAQTYPSRVVTIIVPFPAGGGHDFTARTIAARLVSRLGQQVVVENRGGANGQIGAQAVARAAPDGYTILMGSPAELVISESVYKSMPYDAARDFAPITLAGISPIVLAAHPSTQVKTPKEFLALVKNKPGTMSYGSPGTGSAHHLAAA